LNNGCEAKSSRKRGIEGAKMAQGMRKWNGKALHVLNGLLQSAVHNDGFFFTTWSLIWFGSTYAFTFDVS
jgi:hypothetical protein